MEVSQSCFVCGAPQGMALSSVADFLNKYVWTQLEFNLL
jgi:hypothetical protein